MLKLSEIKQFIDEDRTSSNKQKAKKGLDYYEAKHDIRDYKVFYVNAEGELVEDNNRSNIRMSHPFFTELIDQCTQYALSGKDRYVISDDKGLQDKLDKYFDDEFLMELSDVISYGKIEGSSFLYRYMGEDERSHFEFADFMHVVECPAKYTSDKKDYVIRYFFDRKEKEDVYEKCEVWDEEKVTYYIIKNGDVRLNKERPARYHIDYQETEEGEVEYDTFGSVPFFRFDNNRTRTSDLYVIKNLIDDYDLMACGLSNNLQDVAEGIYVVKGWNGNSLDELTQNIRVKKQVAVGEGGDFDIKTINVPYQARLTKMLEDEKNIYRFGMGFNASAMGDGNVTNVVIRSRYALLDMKCNKLDKQIKKLMKKVIKIVIDEINERDGTNHAYSDVWCDFKREIMTNATDNAQIEILKAQAQQLKIANLMTVANQIGDEELLERLCEVLDLDYEEIKAKIKANAPIDLNAVTDSLEAVEVENEENPQGN